MLGLLENSETDPGFTALDQVALAGLVTIQTLGCILPELTHRRAATLTDAALIAPLIEQTMQNLQNNDQSKFDLGHISYYRFSRMLADAHRVSLAVQSERFVTYCMELAMGDSQHTAKIIMAFPVSQNKVDEKTSTGPQKIEAERKVFFSLPAKINAELHRFYFAWSDLSQLKVGAHLILPDTVFENVQLKTARSSEFISAKLGRLAQFRAVQVDIAIKSLVHYSANPNAAQKKIGNHSGEPTTTKATVSNSSAKDDSPELVASLDDKALTIAQTENI